MTNLGRPIASLCFRIASSCVMVVYRLLISIDIIKRWSDGGMGVDFRMLTRLWEFFRNDGCDFGFEKHLKI